MEDEMARYGKKAQVTVRETISNASVAPLTRKGE